MRYIHVCTLHRHRYRKWKKSRLHTGYIRPVVEYASALWQFQLSSVEATYQRVKLCSQLARVRGETTRLFAGFWGAMRVEMEIRTCCNSQRVSSASFVPAVFSTTGGLGKQGSRKIRYLRLPWSKHADALYKRIALLQAARYIMLHRPRKRAKGRFHTTPKVALLQGKTWLIKWSCIHTYRPFPKL